MKKTKKYFVIFDTKNKLFWKENIHYGFGPGNKVVKDARFTNDLGEATLLSKQDAKRVFRDFCEQEYVMHGKFKADVYSLQIVLAHLTLEVHIP